MGGGGIRIVVCKIFGYLQHTENIPKWAKQGLYIEFGVVCQ